MIIEPFIAHSKVTNEIYIVCGAEKYCVTEQVIKAMQNTGRLEQESDEDCVSRQRVLEEIDDCSRDGLKGMFCSYVDGERFKEYIKRLPSITVKHGNCKDCNYRDPQDKMCDCGHFIRWQTPRPDNWYCADFEKRGNEDE